jgi:Ca-activated chloride channel family protein
MRPTHRRLPIALSLLALLALAGCGGGRHASSNSAQSGAAVAGGLAVDGNTSAKAPAAGGAALATTPLQQRAVVRTATLAVTVSKVDQAADSALAAAQAAGGRVDGDDRNEDSTGRHAELVLRVPAAKLDALLGTVSRLGHEDSRSVHGEDVTANQADVTARVQELTISVARLQDFLKHSGSISDLVSLESQLTQRESDLQSTAAQQRALSDQVDLSTLTVDLHTAAGAVRTGSGPAGFGSAIRDALDGLLLSLRWLAALLGYLLPFLVVLAIPGVPATLWWRRSRRNRGPAPIQPPQPATE